MAKYFPMPNAPLLQALRRCHIILPRRAPPEPASARVAYWRRIDRGAGKMPGALDGIRVLEFGHYVAAPLLGMLLADQGAEVIKVEPTGGEPGRRSDSYQVWNRGKTSFETDLTDPDALARV